MEAVYARGLYPGWSRAAVALSGHGALPWTVPLTAVAGLALAAALLRARGRAARAATVALAAALAWASFTASWGLLYRRARAPVVLGLTAEAASPAELRALTAWLLERVRADAAAPPDEAAAIAAIGRALAAEDGPLGAAPAGRAPTRVKRLPAGTLTTFGYAGIVSPWTLEAHLDGALPPASRVAVAAHELAHVAGLAHEADADLVGALAGLAAEHPYARYATALALLGRALASLPEVERDALRAELPPRAARDLELAREAAERYYRPALARPLGGLYERYLRATGVREGRAAYGAVLELLARAARAGRLEGLEPAAD